MHDLLAGWSRLLAVNGVVLRPPAPLVGQIRIHDREPIRPMRDLVGALHGGLPPGASFMLTDGPRALTTVDGEHAAFLEGTVQLGDMQVQRSVGVVMADDRFAVIDGRVDGGVNGRAGFGLFHDGVHALTRRYSLGLGSHRWRSYYYQAPTGWQGLPRVRAHVWLAPGYPRSPGMLSVFHARPSLSSEATAQHRFLYEDVTSDLTRIADPLLKIPARRGFARYVAEFAGAASPDRRIINIALKDDHYVYLLRLETDVSARDQQLAIFEDMVASVLPIPATERVQPAVTGHWLE